MSPKYLIFAAAAAGMALVNMPVVAHHSAIQFDFQQSAELTGTVKLLRVVNPHARLVLTVSDASGTRDVVFEGHSRNNYYRDGWRRGLISAGDTITVVYAPMRDGSDGGFVNQFVLESGQKIGLGT